MMIRGYEIGVRAIVLTLIGLMLIAAFVFGTSQCASRKTAEKQAEVSQGQAGAAIDSGSEAMNTVGNVMTNDAATDALVGMGQTEIAAATQGTKGKAAKRAACRLRAYKDTPQCQEPKP
jgi:hypothetical protein